MSEWQPIETAPDDGYLLLVAPGFDDEPRIVIGAPLFGRWYVQDTESLYCEPTHWMPLPKLPV